MQWAYTLALIGFTVIGFARREASQVFTPLLLLANQAACSSVVLMTGDYYPVLFFVTVDYACGLALFIARQSIWQNGLIGIYALQLVCHAAYALSDMGAGPTYYGYWVLTYLGWAQLALIGGWLATDLVGDCVSFSRRRHAEQSDAAHQSKAS